MTMMLGEGEEAGWVWKEAISNTSDENTCTKVLSLHSGQAQFAYSLYPVFSLGVENEPNN